MMKPVLNTMIRFAVAIIYLQTLYFKFSAHPDSVYIFSTLGLEPYGRIGLGIAELVVAILLIRKQTVIPGMLLSVGIISGAIAAHLGPLGINVQNDGGKVFGLAALVFLLSVYYLIGNNAELKLFLSKHIMKKQ